MTPTPHLDPARDLPTAAWRKSSFSNATGNCVEFAPLDDGRIAVRNSNHPGAAQGFGWTPELTASPTASQVGATKSPALQARKGGAPPTRAELGQTENAVELVPGDPGAVGASGMSLARFGQLMSDTGANLTQLDNDGWTGPAGQAFDAYFQDEPTRWVRAGDAFASAAQALTGYVDTLRWAQGQAAEAIVLVAAGRGGNRPDSRPARSRRHGAADAVHRSG